MNITLGITGASGVKVGLYLLRELLNKNVTVHFVCTVAGMITIQEECDFKLSTNPVLSKKTLIEKFELKNTNNFYVYTNANWYAPIASGSSVSDAMVICPCSMASLAKISNGIADDLLHRAADVIIKERKNLILAPRETPLSFIHLDNMSRLAKIGVSILPLMPAFYLHPESIDDIIIFFVSRILDQLGIKNTLIKRWT